jgi:hypothetical protein
VFERLVHDVLERIASAPDSPAAAAQSTLEQWRDLIRVARQPIDPQKVVGLTGELEVLARLGSEDPRAALDAWVGCRGAVHDFASGSRALEVKATASVDGSTIAISNIDQLDADGLSELLLVAVHCRERPSAPSLDDRIRHLFDMGFPRTDLIDAVSAAGYVFESATPDVPRFETRTVRVWKVNFDFPGLRRSDLPEERRRGVTRIRYDLSLDTAPPPMAEAEGDAALAGWVGR